MGHMLGGEQTIGPDQGLFLEETWRLHPDICIYTSELFYEGKLHSKPGLEVQVIKGEGSPVTGAGLRYLPVPHYGNQNCAPEEAAAVAALVNGILASKATWIDRDGQEKPVTLKDIVIITPYNAQVFDFRNACPAHMSARSISFKDSRRRLQSTRPRPQVMPTRRAAWNFSTASTGSTSRPLARSAFASSSPHPRCSTPNAGRHGRYNRQRLLPVSGNGGVGRI